MSRLEHRSLLPQGRRGRVVALCGGVGGAKLALGLERTLAPGRLTVAVNTGDDFEYLGLQVSPDLDTVLYTLGGLSDETRGWGRADESWAFMGALERWGGDTWFSLGDRDLALHVERTRRLHAGETLTAIMGDMARRAGIGAQLLPMSDEAVRTIVHTPEGDLPFQHYFVKHRCAPQVTGVSFSGADLATANPALTQALADPDLAAVVICPSNPFLSIDPILAVPGVRAALRRTAAPIVVVSPIVGGQAVKGPTAKIMAELGLCASSATVAAHYAGLIDGMVIDNCDAQQADALGLPVHVTQTLMRGDDDKRRLAGAVLDFAAALSDTLAKTRKMRSAP
ncbi:MAG TPA: 2-phospho-L-lactate transferase [Ramlibacter sp.]|nr:2-phospho-L-lactate transferase [Ramlibacter sp.]